MSYAPGSLVRVRNREWVVMPSPQPDELLLLRPLGGGEEETTGIFLPLAFAEDRPTSAEFPRPQATDLGDFASARLLYNAARLSFRSGAGPFRSLAKLSFRPRPYQMVPLIMALRQRPAPVRLLVADDVGVGKTVEAILILKELLERREIDRFAVICLPHLCEQWQAELLDKAGIDAVIIRSNTQARLDREVPGHVTSVYQHYPYQVISIDYIKGERRDVFLRECPEFVIVDEAHTAAKPAGAQKSQQQRYHLLHKLAANPRQHLLLLTATPHSGKPEEFSSLLGLLNPAFETLDLPTATAAQRQKLAAHFVQRRRADVEQWLGEDTPFPTREPNESCYVLSPAYREVYADVLALARQLTKSAQGLRGGQQKFHYWTALALLRGVMSSPAAGLEMLRNRQRNERPDSAPDSLAAIGSDDVDVAADQPNPVLDADFGFEGDYTPTQVVSRTDFTASQNARLRELMAKLENIQGIAKDQKAAETLTLITQWLSEGFQPVIFCRYIATAKYLGHLLQQHLTKVGRQVVRVETVTSEDPDEVRRQRIEDMADAPLRVLVATDCLSEGINLQHLFSAVLHYDLPWNPNRLEQREGRVDRYGQPAPRVKAYLLYGQDNPIDGVVLRVILQKVREIRKATGITVPFPEDSKTVMDAVLTAVLLNPQPVTPTATQLGIDFGTPDVVLRQEEKVDSEYRAAVELEKKSRSIFAQNAIKPDEVAEDLRLADEAIGNPAAVEAFVTQALPALLGVQIIPHATRTGEGRGYTLFTTNLPAELQVHFPEQSSVHVSFVSPTPVKHYYLGRNHPFVEQLCQSLLANAVYRKGQAPARAAVLRTAAVDTKTTLLLFRVRNVIAERASRRQLVAEEMLLWGYRGSPSQGNFLTHDEARELLFLAQPGPDPSSPQAHANFLTSELNRLTDLEADFNRVAEQRAENLVAAHDRFTQVVGGNRYQAVNPVLPMDVMGLYVLLPLLKLQ
ncbi:MAG: helicase-related protein [Janthinobacterium lividum]